VIHDLEANEKYAVFPALSLRLEIFIMNPFGDADV